MGSVRNKRHAGRQQQHQHQQHQATKKRKQQQQRQDLRLTIALTKSGGVELKGRLKKPRKSGHRSTDQMSGEGQRESSVSSEPPGTESATAELKAEEEQETTSSPPPPPPQVEEEEVHGDATSGHESTSTTVDANSLVTTETVPEHRNTKKVVMATKSEEESDAEEEEEEEDQQQQKDEDYEKLGQTDEAEVDGDGGLSVTCGENVARLYLSKLRLIARERVQSQCIRFEGSWLTPNEFQRESGREAAKDWKRTIRHNGLCLKQLLSDGIFDFSVSPPVCLCVTCAAAAAATTRRGHGATTNEEMEITASHPSPAFESAAAAATPDQEECLISGLGSAASAAAAAAAYRSGDGDKKEKRRRRSKQRPVKEKRKPFSTSSTSTSSSSACRLTDDSAMLRSPDNSTRKRKSSPCQFDRPTDAELTDVVAETFERLDAAKSDEMTAESDSLTKHLDGVTTPTDQMTLEPDLGTPTTADRVTTELDGMAVDTTSVSAELHPVMPVLEGPDGDAKCPAQEPGLAPKKKRRKKSKKNLSSIETSETQQVNNQDFVQADSHSFIDPKIPDDRWSSKENEAIQELIGKAGANHAQLDGCNVEASVCFQALAICGEVQKQTCGLDEDQQVTAGKCEKIVDGNNVCEKDLSEEDTVIRNPDRLDSNEIATLTGRSPSRVNSSEDDHKNRDFRSSSRSVSLTEGNAHTEIEVEGQTRETMKALDNGDIPRGLLSTTDEEVCSQQLDMDGSALDKSEVDSVLCESIRNIPTMPFSEEIGPSIKLCLKTDLSDDDRPIPLAENLPLTPGVGVQPDGTSTTSSDQSTGTATVSEAPAGGLPANAITSRNPHLVAVIAELKQKKQLALTSGVKKQNEARQSVLNSDQSKGTGVVSCPNANDAKVSFDVASRFLAAAANDPSLSFSPPRVDNAPVSSPSGLLCQTRETLQQSSGSSADLNQSMVSVISKAAEVQSGTSVAKHRTKTTSGGRSESNRKRSCRPSTAEGKASKGLDGGGKHVTSGKDVNTSSIPLSLPSGLYGLSPSQLASLPFPASPYSLFPPYLFMGFPLQPLLPSCPSSDGKMPSYGMAQTLAAAAAAAAASASSEQQSTQAPPPQPGSRKRRSNQSGKSQGQKTRRGSQTTTPSQGASAPAGMNPMAASMGSDKTLPATSDLLNSMMAFDLLRSRIGMSPPAAVPGLDGPKSAPFYFPWLKPDPSKPDILFGGHPSSSSLLRTMTSDAKLQQAATRTLASPIWSSSEAFARPHEQHPKRPKTGDFRPFDPMSCVVDKKVTPTPPLFSPDFKISRRRDKASLPSSTDQKPFSLAAAAASEQHSSVKNQSLPDSHYYDDVGALDLSLK